MSKSLIELVDYLGTSCVTHGIYIIDLFLSLNLITVLPSPMDGPSKTKKCHYLGQVKVQKASGMDVVNSAIEKISNTTDK